MHAAGSVFVWATVGLLAGCSQRVRDETKSVGLTQADALAIARQAVATNDGPYWLQSNVFYSAIPEGRGWAVLAEKVVGTNDSGEPLMQVGGHRIIAIDEQGTVTYYMRGR